MKKKKLAFTLAEVLITLTILGVVAAISIPNLIRNYQDKAQIAAAIKAYSILDNAIQMAIAENGPVTKWNWPNPDVEYDKANITFYGRMLSKYLGVDKFCEEYGGCTTYGHHDDQGHYYYKSLTGNYNIGEGAWSLNGISTARMVLLKNNMVLYMNIRKLTLPQREPNTITVDTNGTKGPNRYGYDVFDFTLNENGLIVITKQHYYKNADIVNNCNGKAEKSSGTSCSTWVIKHHNMDYKYRDVSKEW